jgi:hypothetical protein
MMKKYYLILISFSLMISCTDYNVADYYTLEELPSYVAFNAPGQNSTMDDINVDDGEGLISMNVEVPTGTLVDITVTYEFTGTAIAGTDYADPNSGTVILKVNPTDTQDFDNVDIEVDILRNPAVTGDLQLIVTLVSAVDTDGKTFAVGRGGTNLLKSATINIADVD